MWVKLDHEFHGNRKVVGLPDSAVGLWTRCVSYCGWQLTDGVVEAPIVRQFHARSRDVDALVDAGLWIPTNGGGFIFHDFLDYNPSREQVKAEAAATRERRREQRLRRQADQRDLFE